jgi:hypothetical protein
MPYDSKLNLQITPAQQQAIITAIENLENVLDDIGTVVIEPKQVKKLQLVGNKRYAYVQRCVKEIAPNNPDLKSLTIDWQRAKNLFDSYEFLSSVQSRFNNLNHRVSSTNYNAQHLLYEYTTDIYFYAKMMRKHSVEAEKVVEYLFELFGRQGNRKKKSEQTGEQP